MATQLQIVNGKCNMSAADLQKFSGEANAAHEQMKGLVDKVFKSLPNEPTDQQDVALQQAMQALLLTGVATDGAFIATRLCARLETGLKLPNAQLPSLKSK